MKATAGALPGPAAGPERQFGRALGPARARPQATCPPQSQSGLATGAPATAAAISAGHGPGPYAWRGALKSSGPLVAMLRTSQCIACVAAAELILDPSVAVL